MNWSIIRLICLRDLRDQLRDRRTLFTIGVLPVLLYPALGIVMVEFARGFREKPSVVGVQGLDNLPRPGVAAKWNHAETATWVARQAAGALAPEAGVAGAAGAVALVQAGQLGPLGGFPPLLVPARGGWQFAEGNFEAPEEAVLLQARRILGDQPLAALEGREVDAVLIVPPEFQSEYTRGHRAAVRVDSRPGDTASQLAAKRLHGALAVWKRRLKEARLASRGLPPDFDDPVEVQDPERSRPGLELAARGLQDAMVRLFPFLLVLWALVGALYPAVDLCAGEKERGTMETLLISPATREEIVWGKFLTIWIFSAATSLLNLVSMGATTWVFGSVLPQPVLTLGSAFWCVVSVLPLSAFFGALSLALGAYARSSKEGQYYLMPMFWGTIPLIFLTLAPGVELNAFYSLVPITGVALLIQRLMTASSLDQVPWLYFIPVLASVALYSSLALRWAIAQFEREDVLFRVGARLNLRQYLRWLFRQKEAGPGVGQVLACFGLVVALRWLFFGSDTASSAPVVTGIGSVVLLTPPLFMAVILTTRPLQTLGLRPAPFWAFLVPALAAVVLLIAAAADVDSLIRPPLFALEELMGETIPSAGAVGRLAGRQGATGKEFLTVWSQYYLLLALLPAVCQEFVFRGFILSGLRRRFSPGVAVLLGAFLFGLYQMNLFRFLPAFAAGVVLGLVAVRCGSILPGLLLHFLYSGLAVGRGLLQAQGWPSDGLLPDVLVLSSVVTLCVLLACVVLGGVPARLLSLRRKHVPTEPAAGPVPEPAPARNRNGSLFAREPLPEAESSS